MLIPLLSLAVPRAFCPRTESDKKRMRKPAGVDYPER